MFCAFKNLGWYIIFITLIMLNAACNEQPELPKSTIYGTVVNTYGNLLDSVACSIVSNKGATITGEDGKFIFNNLTVGKFTLLFTRKNYIAKEVIVELNKEPTLLEVRLNPGIEFLKISDSIKSVNYKEGIISIDVESNSDWLVSSDASWIKPTIGNGGGSQTLLINLELSDNNEIRKGKLKVKTASLTRIISIEQTPPLKIIDTKGIIGNYETDRADSIIVYFNKPLAVNSVAANFQGCVTDINYKVHNNRLVFNYNCAQLADEYSFTITANDGRDNFVLSTQAQFYNEKHLITGSIIDYFILKDNSAMWAITVNPNKLLKIELPQFEIIDSYPLSFAPGKMQYHAYNNTIDIISNRETCIACASNYIFNFDPVKGAIKPIYIEPIYNQANIDGGRYPYEMRIMNNGIGVVLTLSINNDLSWRYRDANSNDTLYNSISNTTKYEGMQMSFDESKLYMMHTFGSTTLDIIEKNSEDVRIYNSPFGGRSNYLVASKKTNRLFHGQLYEQFISDTEDYVSNVSYLDTRSFSFAGVIFSNLPDEDEVIYYAADNYFWVLDYKNAFTPFTCDISPLLYNLQTTLDGKKLMGIKYNNQDTDVIVFDVEDLRKNQAVQLGNNSGRQSVAPFKNVWKRKK